MKINYLRNIMYKTMETIEIFSHYKVGSKQYTDHIGATLESERTGNKIEEIWYELQTLS